MAKNLAAKSTMMTMITHKYLYCAGNRAGTRPGRWAYVAQASQQSRRCPCHAAPAPQRTGRLRGRTTG